MEGIFVGHHERTGASLFLSERGFMRGTNLKVPRTSVEVQSEVRPPPVPPVVMPAQDAVVKTPQQGRRYILNRMWRGMDRRQDVRLA